MDIAKKPVKGPKVQERQAQLALSPALVSSGTTAAAGAAGVETVRFGACSARLADLAVDSVPGMHIRGQRMATKTFRSFRAYRVARSAHLPEPHGWQPARGLRT